MSVRAKGFCCHLRRWRIDCHTVFSDTRRTDIRTVTVGFTLVYEFRVGLQQLTLQREGRYIGLFFIQFLQIDNIRDVISNQIDQLVF